MGALSDVRGGRGQCAMVPDVPRLGQRPLQVRRCNQTLLDDRGENGARGTRTVEPGGGDNRGVRRMVGCAPASTIHAIPLVRVVHPDRKLRRPDDARASRYQDMSRWPLPVPQTNLFERRERRRQNTRPEHDARRIPLFGSTQHTVVPHDRAADPLPAPGRHLRPDGAVCPTRLGQLSY